MAPTWLQEYGPMLATVPLFEGVAPADIASMLACLGARAVPVRRGEMVIAAGAPLSEMGVVLAGQLHVVREDMDGTRSVLSALFPGDFFAETLCCAGVRESPVSVVAEADSTVLMLGFRQILHTCPSACTFHERLIENMLGIVAQKNLQLQARMGFLEKKTLRARITSYLQSVAPGRGQTFAIPFSREELADFLGVDRSALSRELAKLKAEGALDYHKNHFRLL